MHFTWAKVVVTIAVVVAETALSKVVHISHSIVFYSISENVGQQMIHLLCLYICVEINL